MNEVADAEFEALRGFVALLPAPLVVQQLAVFKTYGHTKACHFI